MLSTFPSPAQSLRSDGLSQFKKRQTVHGVTWEYICRSGVANPDSKIGVYAGDAESYTLFWPELRPIIARCHAIFESNSAWHKPRDFRCMTVRGDVPQFEPVRSTRVRMARNLADFCFPSAMGKADRLQVYRLVRDALHDVPGRWFDLSTMRASQRSALNRARLLFTNHDRFMISANIFAHWPLGRAIFVTPNWRAAVWVNEEDHLRIMAIVPGYDPGAALAHLQPLLARLEERLPMAWSPQLGYLTSCPSNLGTGLRASVLARCANADAERFRQLGLQLRGTHGEHSSAVSDLYDISPRWRLGVSEGEIVQQLDTALHTVFTA